MMFAWGRSWRAGLAVLLVVCVLLARPATASVGDRLPEFKECVEICIHENCGADAAHRTPIPLYRRLLFWTCPSECDYTCQHIITNRRLAAEPPRSVEQFHGKWPFVRVLGMQEPMSVLFSAGNFLAHYDGLHNKILAKIPATYPLRRFYVMLAYVSMAAWVFSVIFHVRDFPVTEQLDYFGAGASVLYGMFYTPVRVFRLDRSSKAGVLRAWAVFCIVLYCMHVAYLKLWTWDYTYNMTANVACGVVQNALWSWFSFHRYRKSGMMWAVWPGIVVALVLCAMSLELLDFPPIWGALDAHSLWHLGTIAPTILFYNFLVRDAQDDIAASRRLKA
ncbi:Per1-like-domain-containing protein [Podospora aff. communis PSN243]|uniref:Post-GPI attachment to proteins factor 3 n=1 Tax=Podospora aff. communis PSN243 TaxID=3040156 RepID=A0AAV9H1Z4_9PEZI|nr:Per1-like-domain-containing protein [Podospora aff. communis PSN243]